MNKDQGQVNSSIYDNVTLEEYTETGKLDFDFLLGRHLLHVNNLLSQDLLGDTLTGNSLSIQKCEVGLDVLSNMIEVYTKGKDVDHIAKVVMGDDTKHSNLDLKDDDTTYYDIYKEIRTEKFKRFVKNQDRLNIKTQTKELNKIEFRYNQLSVIHRYLMLWIDECGLTPSTTSGIEIID